MGNLISEMMLLLLLAPRCLCDCLPDCLGRLASLASSFVEYPLLCERQKKIYAQILCGSGCRFCWFSFHFPSSVLLLFISLCCLLPQLYYSFWLSCNCLLAVFACCLWGLRPMRRQGSTAECRGRGGRVKKFGSLSAIGFCGLWIGRCSCASVCVWESSQLLECWLRLLPSLSGPLRFPCTLYR